MNSELRPVFSVITINLNNYNGLRKSIKSVFDQTFSDFEYIVIDGGSTDGSLSIIKEYYNASQLPGSHLPGKFQWISEPDCGIYNAMNKGIKRATGKYCFFLNSGDYFASDEVLTNVFFCNPVEDILYGNLIIQIEGKETERSIGPESLSFFDVYSSRIKHQSTFIKYDLFLKYGFYNESLRIVADWEFFIKTIGFNNATYRYINENIACFDNNGISNNLHEIRLRERQEVLEKYLPGMMLDDYRFLEKINNLKPALKHRLSFLAFRIIAKCVKEYERVFRKP